MKFELRGQTKHPTFLCYLGPSLLKLAASTSIALLVRFRGMVAENTDYQYIQDM